MKTLEKIHINIWDDFYDDGYVPIGEKQETKIYIEESGIPFDKEKQYLEFLLDYINNNLNAGGVGLWMEFYECKKKYPNLIGTDAESLFFDRWEIKIEGLTHERLSEWMMNLENSNISIDGIPFEIYSES